MQLTIKPMTAVLLGIAFAFAFAFLLNGKDYSPSRSVATVAHSTVSTTSDSAWQNNRARLDHPGPERVTIQQPPTILLQLPESNYLTAENSSASGQTSGLNEGAGGTGWRTPKATPTDTAGESATDSSDDTYANEARTQGLTDCDALAKRIHDTHDYRGTADERACFGEEDDDRVALALDYGKTEAGYAASEQTLKPGSYGCMLEADGIVADGWQGTAEQVQCFGYDDLAGINEAYGALEEGRASY